MFRNTITFWRTLLLTGAVVVLTTGAATAAPRGSGFRGGGFQRGFDPRFNHRRFDPRFNHRRFDPRFNHRRFDPRFNRGRFDPRFSPRFSPGFFGPF